MSLAVGKKSLLTMELNLRIDAVEGSQTGSRKDSLIRLDSPWLLAMPLRNLICTEKAFMLTETGILSIKILLKAESVR